MAVVVITGAVRSCIVIILDTGVRGLPHRSAAVHVSVKEPHAGGIAENVDIFEVPEIRHPPESPLEKEIVLAAGNAPHATVMAEGAVITGKAAGLTVIVLVTAAKGLPQISVAVHVSVTVPPQAEGRAEKVDGLEVPDIRHPPDKLLV
jgi:hypothetical protein